MPVEAHIQAQARELVNAWVLKTTAINGVIDVFFIADADWDDLDMLSDALENDKEIRAFAESRDDGEDILRDVFAGFIRFCVQQAEAAEA